MAVTTISSRAFNQDTSGAKRAAKDGPVFITDRGKPAHVLMTIEDFRRLSAARGTITDMLAMPAGANIEFEPPRLTGPITRAADLT